MKSSGSLWKNIRHSSCLILLLLLSFPVSGSYLRNVPRTLTQPDGQQVQCFVSGDEFYHYLHDSEGFTIVQNPQTGYFVYAVAVNGMPVPSPYTVNRVNPRELGLVPHIVIPAEEWQRRKMAFPAANSARQRSVQTGTLQNLAVFIRFADDNAFSLAFPAVESVFNDSSAVASNSVYNYFKVVSYNQLHIVTSFFPEPAGNAVLSYQDSQVRGYYEPYSAANPLGYADSDERWAREQALVANAARFIANSVPADLLVDRNGDGKVDNICFLVKGDVGDWGELLWPHRTSLTFEQVFINDCAIENYNFIMCDNEWYFSTSTLCHEMYHSLGAPDLYHYNAGGDLLPVGTWDLMGQNENPPQQMGSYMKYKYGGWIPEILTISQSGTYYVNTVDAPGNSPFAYFIPTEEPDQFLLVEARRNSALFESRIPESGVLIYRINTQFAGNTSWDGINWFDEVYIYRPNGTVSQNGDLSRAAYRDDGQHNTSLDYSTNPRPFLSNGYVSAARIYDVQFFGDWARFSYLAPGDTLSVAENVGPSLRVFPNPASSQVAVALPDDCEVADAVLYDASGRKVAVPDLATKTSFSVEKFPSGLYVLRVKLTDGATLYEKILISAH